MLFARVFIFSCHRCRNYSYSVGQASISLWLVGPGTASKLSWWYHYGISMDSSLRYVLYSYDFTIVENQLRQKFSLQKTYGKRKWTNQSEETVGLPSFSLRGKKCSDQSQFSSVRCAFHLMRKWRELFYSANHSTRGHRNQQQKGAFLDFNPNEMKAMPSFPQRIGEIF